MGKKIMNVKPETNNQFRAVGVCGTGDAGHRPPDF